MSEALTAETWPIAACLNGLPASGPDGEPMHEADPAAWASVFREVAAEGFTLLELADGWLKPACMSPERRADLVAVAREHGLAFPAIHVQRASVIEPGRGEQNLAYAHASIDAAAELGIGVFSTGLHQPFSEAQRAALWFWTAEGPKDPMDDEDVRAQAVARIRELGQHAAAVGMQLSLELYEDTYLGTASSAVRFIEDVDLANVGLNPDVANLIRLHRPVEHWRELYAATLPYANYWHLKNYQRDEAADGSWSTSTPSTLQNGIINYRDVVSEAIALGYRGVMMCEHYGGDTLSVGAENARYLRRMIANALQRQDPALLGTKG